MSRKLTYTQVQKIFEDGGCELLSEYVSYDVKVKYKCSCGIVADIFLGNFKKGQRCRDCGSGKIRKTKTLPIGEVKKIFEDQNCKLLSTNYFSGEKLKYR